MRTSFPGPHAAEHVKQAVETRRCRNACEIDKQWVDVILCDNVWNMKNAMDDMAVTRVGCVAQILPCLVVHEGLLSQTHLLTQGQR